MKEILKRFPPAVYINAQLKGVQTKLRYEGWCRNYNTCSCLDFREKDDQWREYFSSEIESSVKDRLVGESRELFRRVFYVGTSWDQDRSGLIQGLQAHADVYIFQGPDRKRELRLPRDKSEIESCRNANGMALKEEFAAFRAKGEVHALLGQMWNFVVPASVLSEIAISGIPIVNIAMDDRHSFHKDKLTDGSDGGVAGLAPVLTLGATAAPECVSWYSHFGKEAIFFPEASNSAVFRPMDLSKAHDITFVGANYGFRSQIIASLRQAGLNVTTYGTGWNEGRIETEAIPELFARSRIILGVGAILHCTDFTALKLRDFDAPMSGSFYLAQENPDLSLVYKVGAEIETWSNTEDLIAKCRYFLDNAVERERIASAGLARAKADHTWSRRFSKLFRKLDVVVKKEGF